FSTDGKMVLHNKKRINEHLGYRPKQNVIFKKLLSKESYDSLQLTFQKALKGSYQQIEFNVLNRNEQQLDVLATFIPIEAASKNLEGVFLILKDITGQKKLEMQLIEAKNSYRHIFDHLHVGIWMRDSIEGNVIFASKGL